jgi:exopolyphosphatase/guanosine-5'-triphosphate,3'-diphosphate pyrophosphatase
MKVAAIDIGSNAVRLQVARLNFNTADDRIKKIEFVRVPIRLGDDAFKNKKISKEKKGIFIKTMKSFKLLMEVFEVEHYTACATSAMREATNAKKILNEIKKDIGLKINIIDGKEESKIILKSIEHCFKPGTNYLTIDVGGGSTEMTLIDNGKIVTSVSFNLGTVRLRDGEVSEKTWQNIEEWVIKNTNGIKQLEAVVTSGTINKISSIINKGGCDGYFSRDELKNFHRKVLKMSIPERIDKLKLNPDRADIIDVSADIYLRILNWANITKIYAPANAGLKDGILNMLYDKFKAMHQHDSPIVK